MNHVLKLMACLIVGESFRLMGHLGSFTLMSQAYRQIHIQKKLFSHRRFGSIKNPFNVMARKTKQNDNELSEPIPFVSTKSNFPVQHRDSRLPPTSSPLEIVFLGTASCIPTFSRGVSCTALRNGPDIWLFDVGEGSQVKIQTSSLKLSRIRKIFLTHAHGDHTFGLPGLLCLLGAAHQLQEGNLSHRSEMRPIDIYGPQGIRDYLRTSLRYTFSRNAVTFRVHELYDIAVFSHQGNKTYMPSPASGLPLTESCGELHGGLDIYPDRNGIYHLPMEEEGGVTVRAAPMAHTIPTVGYVVETPKQVGALQPKKVMAAVAANKDLLNRLPELNNNYLKLLGVLKGVRYGEDFHFPDGTVLNSRDFLDPPRSGCKLVFMGDTSSGRYIEKIAMDADVLVHEATIALDAPTPRAHAYRKVDQEAISRGHSTPQMAGRFAAAIRAKKLVLTHFSSRYSGVADLVPMKTMWLIEDFARSTSKLLGPNDVVAAWDLMRYPVQLSDVVVDDVEANSKNNELAANLSSRFKEMWERSRIARGEIVETPPSN